MESRVYLYVQVMSISDDFRVPRVFSKISLQLFVSREMESNYANFEFGVCLSVLQSRLLSKGQIIMILCRCKNILMASKSFYFLVNILDSNHSLLPLNSG